ncbi:MAG TPA: TonB-dependent receptor [Flavobacterium sp.]|jgi:TonB-linked SusC/RagA family outer membrane protein
MEFKKLLFYCLSTVLFTTYVGAQTVTVTGKVLDETGLPLPGVSVSVPESTTGTTTDIDGNYSIAISGATTLVFSYVGYADRSEIIAGRTIINVSLVPNTQNLDEVVVVGYGTQKRSVVTGAITGIKASDIEDAPITRVEQALQGRVSGVVIASNAGQPGSSSTIRVRGITSLNSGNDPLWVVDGIIVDPGGIGFINSSDIESVEVLKDGAASIYGTRAAGGVILITTKKGKAGKLTVNYNGFGGFSGPARKLDLLNAQEYASLRNEAYAAGYNGTGTFTLPFPNAATLGAGTDWQEAIFSDSAFRESHELSISGGSDKSTFYMSFGLIDQEGIVLPQISNYSRKNIRMNSTHKIGKFVTFGQTAAFSDEKNVGIGNTNSEFGGPLSSAINLDPTTPLVETDPAVIASQNDYSQTGVWLDPNGNPYGISTQVGQEMSNPLAYARTRQGNYGWSQNFVGSAFLEVAPIKGLKLRSQASGKLAYWGGEGFNPVSYLNSSTFTPRNSLSRDTNRGLGWTLENTLSYERSFGNHNFTILLGQGTYVEEGSRGQGTTFLDLPVDSWEDASFNFDIPQENRTTFAYTNPKTAVTSLFTRLNYDYKEKYLLSGIVRRDGSTQFGANHKYGNFPYLSAGWVVTKEDFWPVNKVVNSLKFRASYGEMGNDRFPSFRYLSLVQGGSNYTFGNGGSVTVGNSVVAPSNPDLKWEETTIKNVAVDALLFKNITFTFDLFQKRTTDILYTVQIPGYVGATQQPYANVASMDNNGFEIELGYRKKFGDFNLGLNANLSYIQNELTRITQGVDFISGPSVQSSTYPITRSEVGQPFGSFYGFQTQGIFQNQAEIDSYVNSEGTVIQPNAVPGDFRWSDMDDNGVIDENDRTYLGNPLPDYTFGFTVNLDYKNFDLQVFAQGAAGHQIYQGLRRLDIGNANWQSAALDRWTGEGTSNTYPRLTTNDTNRNFSNPSDFYLQDGDYLRIKIVQLGYSLPTKVISGAGLTRARVYVTGENLFTFTEYTGYDPEIGGNIMGIDRGFYPQAKSFMMGVNLQF